MNKRGVGKFYEEQAVRYLENKSHILIKKNFYTPFGEIDLITQLGNRIHFIEVKFLTSINKIYPVQKIDSAKIKRIFFSISYLKKFCKILNYQVDSVCIYFKSGKLNYEYYSDLRI